MPISTLKPFQQRVIDEKQELDAKREKLTTFIIGSTYQTLDPNERLRLSEQLTVMAEYSQILGQRIAAFE